MSVHIQGVNKGKRRSGSGAQAKHKARRGAHHLSKYEKQWARTALNKERRRLAHRSGGA